MESHKMIIPIRTKMKMMVIVMTIETVSHIKITFTKYCNWALIYRKLWLMFYFVLVSLVFGIGMSGVAQNSKAW